jgi:hypothetical protein
MGGEGSGKSFHGGLYATCRMFYDLQFNGSLYWVVGADFEDARKDFDYIVSFQQQLDNIAQLSQPSHLDQQCVLTTKTGQRVVTISSYDFTKIAREEPDGIIGAEVSRWYQETLDRCEGRLIRKYPNAWGIFTGSFESSDGWLPTLYNFGQGPNDRDLRSFSIPSWANRVKFPLGREDPAIKRAEAGRSPEKFMERFGGKPVPSRRLVCHNFRVTQHVDYSLAYDPDLPLYIGVDPGGVVYAIVFVQFPEDGGINVIDEIYAHRWTHEEVISELLGRPYGKIIAGGAIDVAAKQNQNAMPIAIEEWYNDTGLNLWAQKQAVDDTVERLAWALSNNPNTGRPRLRIHPYCTGIISEMGGGQSPIPDGGAWMRYESREGLGPPMRRNDHACKALGYLLGGPYGLQVHDKAINDFQPVSYISNSFSTQRYRGESDHADYLGRNIGS